MSDADVIALGAPCVSRRVNDPSSSGQRRCKVSAMSALQVSGYPRGPDTDRRSGLPATPEGNSRPVVGMRTASDERAIIGGVAPHPCGPFRGCGYLSRRATRVGVKPSLHRAWLPPGRLEAFGFSGGEVAKILEAGDGGSSAGRAY